MGLVNCVTHPTAFKPPWSWSAKLPPLDKVVPCSGGDGHLDYSQKNTQGGPCVLYFFLEMFVRRPCFCCLVFLSSQKNGWPKPPANFFFVQVKWTYIQLKDFGEAVFQVTPLFFALHHKKNKVTSTCAKYVLCKKIVHLVGTSSFHIAQASCVVGSLPKKRQHQGPEMKQFTSYIYLKISPPMTHSAACTTLLVMWVSCPLPYARCKNHCVAEITLQIGRLWSLLVHNHLQFVRDHRISIQVWQNA